MPTSGCRTATAVYTATPRSITTQHADWLGSARLGSQPYAGRPGRNRPTRLFGGRTPIRGHRLIFTAKLRHFDRRYIPLPRVFHASRWPPRPRRLAPLIRRIPRAGTATPTFLTTSQSDRFRFGWTTTVAARAPHSPTIWTRLPGYREYHKETGSPTVQSTQRMSPPTAAELSNGFEFRHRALWAQAGVSAGIS